MPNFPFPSDHWIDKEKKDEHIKLEIDETIQPGKKGNTLYKVLRFVFTIGFVVFAGLFLYEVVILPIRIDKGNEQAQSLYKRPPSTIRQKDDYGKDSDSDKNPDTSHSTTSSDPDRDQYGRLLQFQDLLNVNSDVKGYIVIPNTNIDLPVVQSSNDDPEYYLTRAWNKEPIKSGSLFLDEHSSVEEKTRNLVIHGHNMKSTNNMFHHLIRYKDIGFMKQNPVFTFDTIYETGEWKIFSYIITNGSGQNERFFNYQKANFKDDSDFMNFVYQLRIRSRYNIDDVDVNEDDQILCLSTCSYELDDYRTVIVARKIREGEDPTVDTANITRNKNVLYPQSFYDAYGGEPPNLPDTFEEALEADLISWYKPKTTNKEETQQ